MGQASPILYRLKSQIYKNIFIFSAIMCIIKSRSLFPYDKERNMRDMICRVCGTESEGEFCPYCGTPLGILEIKTGEKNEAPVSPKQKLFRIIVTLLIIAALVVGSIVIAVKSPRFKADAGISSANSSFASLQTVIV
jgi:hypothetical protein